MKFTCPQQTLAKALNVVSKAITNRTTIPILKGILLEADHGQLTLTASDLELSIETKIDVQVGEEGALVVSAKLFSDIIRKLPAGMVEVEEKENNMIVIRCMSSEFTIVGQSADEFPNTGDVEETNSIKMEKEMFKDMVRKTAFAASLDESKGIILGVLIDIGSEMLQMVALDGYRMAITREHVRSDETRKIIIAARILNEVNKVVMDSDSESDMNIVLDQKKAMFLTGDTKIVVRMLEGQFIDFKNVIPKSHNTRVRLSRSELLEAIERASLLARDGKNNLIRISVGDTTMTVTSRSEEGNVKEEINIAREGDGLEIGFNSKYLLDVLKVVSDDEVYLEFNSSVSPCMIRPVEGDAFEYLVLPVRISN
ncbi:MAG: DNA polymerase III subunit beta [Firmicutes bacterium]|nr:DNA polymerase III subunit beta [Bacillota bacterium]